MTATAERLKPLLRELAQDDRADLAHFLLGTLDEDEPPFDISQNAGESLDELLRRRSQECSAGPPINVPVEEALAELRKLLP